MLNDFQKWVINQGYSRKNGEIVSGKELSKKLSELKNINENGKSN